MSCRPTATPETAQTAHVLASVAVLIRRRTTAESVLWVDGAYLVEGVRTASVPDVKHVSRHQQARHPPIID